MKSTQAKEIIEELVNAKIEIDRLKQEMKALGNQKRIIESKIKSTAQNIHKEENLWKTLIPNKH